MIVEKSCDFSAKILFKHRIVEQSGQFQYLKVLGPLFSRIYRSWDYSMRNLVNLQVNVNSDNAMKEINRSKIKQFAKNRPISPIS